MAITFLQCLHRHCLTGRHATTIKQQLQRRWIRSVPPMCTRTFSTFSTLHPNDVLLATASHDGSLPTTARHYYHGTSHNNNKPNYASSHKPLSNSRNNEGHQRRTSSPEALRNHRILQLGKRQQWKEILNLYQRESAHYNHINYATTLVQLGKIIRAVDDHHHTVVLSSFRGRFGPKN
jgi:hypothetical protein